MKTFFTGVFLALISIIRAQDTIQHRIILIGDAGEIDVQQSSVVTDAAKQVISGKTVVVFLGDNIYPTGMGLPGSPEEEHTQQILQAQYDPLRKNNASVYFIPGNHDWDRMGKQGLAKIRAQSKFINQQQDSALQFVPPDGCPDPVAINVTPHLTIIAFDSEWWLFRYTKKDSASNCSCNTDEDVTNKMEKLLKDNYYKTILLVNHHPFKTYGHHGDYFNWKDNLFPLTAANKYLYIPLPIIGSLYPLLRKVFTNPEDVRHPLYRKMTGSINNVFHSFPNLVHASGHEHGMQFIKNGDFVQIVSGAGAKDAFVKKGKYSLFAKREPGYVVADELPDNSMRFSYYTSTIKGGDFKNKFIYTLPYKPVR